MYQITVDQTEIHTGTVVVCFSCVFVSLCRLKGKLYFMIFATFVHTGITEKILFLSMVNILDLLDYVIMPFNTGNIKKSETEVKIDTEVLEWFQTYVGLRHGCMPSPTLFIVILYAILKIAIEALEVGIKVLQRKITQYNVFGHCQPVHEQQIRSANTAKNGKLVIQRMKY